MFDHVKQILLLAEALDDKEQLIKALQAQGLKVDVSTDITSIDCVHHYFLLLVSESFYRETQAKLTEKLDVITPAKIPIIIIETTASHSSYVQDPVVYGTLRLDKTDAELNEACQLLSQIVSREALFSHTLHKNKRIYAHITHEKDVANTMYGKICHYSCFDSKNIKMHYSDNSLFRGDLFLASRKPSGDLQLLLGDFTGEGLATAIGALPMAEIFFGMTRKGFSFESILREINKKLYTILPVDIYCAACLVDINAKKNEVKLWNGGLPDLYLLNGLGHIYEVFSSNHMPLGICSDDNFHTEIVTFMPNPDDSLFMFSSGIFKIQNKMHETYSPEQLRDLFEQETPNDQLLEKAITELTAFAGRPHHVNAITIIQAGFQIEQEKEWSDIKSEHTSELKPIDWSLELLLKPHSLRNFDPLPVLLHIIMEQPRLEQHRSRIYAIMAELFSNALDHGILGLDSKDKSNLTGFSEYYRKRKERLATLENAYVKVKLSNLPDAEGGRIILIIEDSGPGFDYSKERLDYKKNNGYSGRGMPMIQDMSESVRYFGRGNCVEVVYRWT